MLKFLLGQFYWYQKRETSTWVKRGWFWHQVPLDHFQSEEFKQMRREGKMYRNHRVFCKTTSITWKESE